ncbi:hypothetical protein KP509_37G061400 [Ceratopteris richardii]|uniref:QWRF motif-containing protein 2 n=1 Tax=Ceratopteris richardii TaxID=49495 RepID=A0A8T2Q996_CERRI|nr:hypothetical protein KP509_37G061400 [Ceratopteris richardii]KAH7280324.1 hypothetical protein KP509_37G061400 [Ceratopteris richardii]KAH7280325.1 hypothetical protein KP509_37G061400 [Ceratopteris richardii]
MVMSDAACLVQSPHQVKHTSREASIAGAALRRPRNREVTSRYKSPAPSSTSPSTAVQNRRFPTPSAERPKHEAGSASVVSAVQNLRFPTPTSDRPRQEVGIISPAFSSSRRFPTPIADRSFHSSNVSSPKRAISAERRRPSPTRTAEPVQKGNDAAPPRRSSVRADLLWPSTRSLTSSMQLDSFPLPPPPQLRKHVEIKGTFTSVNADQTLKPTANVVHKAAVPRRPTPERKATPIRNHNTDQVENAKPHENLQKRDQHGKAGSSNGKFSGAALNKSVDLSKERERPLSRTASLTINGSSIASQASAYTRAKSPSVSERSSISSSSLRANVVRSESRGRRRDSPSRDNRGPNSPLLSSKASSGASRALNEAVDQVDNPARLNGQACELASVGVPVSVEIVSDTDSVSSGGTSSSSLSRCTSTNMAGNGGVRRTAVPARFLQDVTSRTRRLPENKLCSPMPDSEVSATDLVGRLTIRCKTFESPQGSHASQTGPAPSSPWSSASSIRSGSNSLLAQQPLSPMKSSPYRMSSPSKSRGGPTLTLGQRSSSAAVMLNFGPDVRRGRKGLNQMEEIHLHRILHNRLLQWRFVNARTDEAMAEQTAGAEKSLYNVYMRIFYLRSSVVMKKVQLQQGREVQKLNALLSQQKPRLEDWSTLQQSHSQALNGAIEALEAAVLRVPVTGGVKADVASVQDAISSAFKAMNFIENSVAHLSPKADKANSLVSELGCVAAQERVLLEECASLLATVSALEMEERSIRTHLVQCEHERARVLGHLMDNTTPLPETVRH